MRLTLTLMSDQDVLKGTPGSGILPYSTFNRMSSEITQIIINEVRTGMAVFISDSPPAQPIGCLSFSFLFRRSLLGRSLCSTRLTL